MKQTQLVPDLWRQCTPRFKAFILNSFAAVLLAACGGSGSEDNAAPVAVPPAITGQPLSISVEPGKPANFSVTASGFPSPGFAWERSDDGGTSYAAIAGASAATYSMANVTLNDDGARLRVLIQNSAGSVRSAAATLTVSPPLGASVKLIMPASTDPTLTQATTDPHVAISPASAPVGKLFVFLPGTQGVPLQYSQILKAGASRGYHAVGIRYPNESAVGRICGNQPAASDCFWKVRREVITGENLWTSGTTADDVDVGASDSILGRLQKLLSHLNALYPGEGWGQYLDATQPSGINWSKLVLAGHSQGAGHVGVMAKLYRVSRVAYFSSPADWTETGSTSEPAAWYAYPSLTPASVQFGFTYVQDGLVAYAKLIQNWSALGLTVPAGGPVSVDANTAPFGGAHLLKTSLPPGSGTATGLDYHSAPVVDAKTPMIGTIPAFLPVWAYMCFD